MAYSPRLLSIRTIAVLAETRYTSLAHGGE